MDYNNRLKNLLLEFEKNYLIISNFNLAYKISRFFSKKLDLFDYKNKWKTYLFYKDKDDVWNHISIYEWIDKSDNSKGIIIEYIIWETNNKDIMFFSDWKVYNILENKWWKILDSRVIDDKNNILNLIDFIERELEFLNQKTIYIKNKLRIKWLLQKQHREKNIQEFKINIKTEVFNLV